MGPDSSPATSTLSSSPRSSASSALASSATDIGVFVASFVSAFAVCISSPRPLFCFSPPPSSNDASEPEEMPRNPKPSAPPTAGSSSRSSDLDRDGGGDGRGSSFVFSAFSALTRSSSRFASALSACSNISMSTSGGADVHFARRERSASLEYDVTEAFAAALAFAFAAAAAAASSSFRFFSSSFSRFFRSRFSLRAASLSSLGFSPSPG